MAIALAVNQPLDPTGNEMLVTGLITLSGSYATFVTGTPPTGGEVFDIETLNYGPQGMTFTASSPASVSIQEEPPAGIVPSGYRLIWVPGTDLTNGNIVVMNGLAQFAAGAYSAAILASTWRFRVFALNV